MCKKVVTVPVLRPDRVRQIRGGFSWIDHRFLRDGHMAWLSRDAIALYAFLVLVGNRDGVSFWRLEKICDHLDRMDWGTFHQARAELIKRDLISFRPFSGHDPNGFYQVLALDGGGKNEP
jgi:hypothetical protein